MFKIDADPGPWRDPRVLAEMRHTRTPESCAGKGTAQPLSQGESAPTRAWTGFCCFSGHITWRMVFIYYAQVRFRRLPFTENKGEDVTSYIKEEGYLQMQREKWLNWLHSSLEGSAQILGSYFKDLQ